VNVLDSTKGGEHLAKLGKLLKGTRDMWAAATAAGATAAECQVGHGQRLSSPKPLPSRGARN